MTSKCVMPHQKATSKRQDGYLNEVILYDSYPAEWEPCCMLALDEQI